jgi:predicted CDP-diglyceride synthetase/phosphatidate cytidylyltransferase
LAWDKNTIWVLTRQFFKEKQLKAFFYYKKYFIRRHGKKHWGFPTTVFTVSTVWRLLTI